MTSYDPRTPEGRQALRDLIDAASMGPWGPRDENGDFELRYGDFGYYVCADGLHSDFCMEAADSEQGKADVAFVAESRTALPAALDCIEEQQRRIEELEAERTEWQALEGDDSLRCAYLAARRRVIELEARVAKPYAWLGVAVNSVDQPALDGEVPK